MFVGVFGWFWRVSVIEMCGGGSFLFVKCKRGSLVFIGLRIFRVLSLLVLLLLLSKLLFWSMMFEQFCHFSLNLKAFKSGSLLFQFCCHFGPISKSAQIVQKSDF
ncbi:hypothetical protein Hanom_Chr09g00836861 [Helianthus anomalus]